MNIEEIRARIIRRLENTAPIETPGTWYHEDIPTLLSEIDRLTSELGEAECETKTIFNTSIDHEAAIEENYKTTIDRLTSELEQKNRELEGCQPQRWIETAVEMCGGIGKNYWVWVESSKRILLVKYDGDGWFQDGVISIPCTDVAYWMPLNLPELPYEISEVNKDAK